MAMKFSELPVTKVSAETVSVSISMVSQFSQVFSREIWDAKHTIFAILAKSTEIGRAWCILARYSANLSSVAELEPF